MAQERYYNFGGTASDTAENLIHYVLHPKGVYRGFDLNANAGGDLVIESGSGLQHNGIIWREDDERVISFSAPGAPTNYTLQATHDNVPLLGGTPIEYELIEGIFTDNDITNGVVMGWVFHPGGGVPLDLSHILSVDKKLPTEYITAAQEAQPVELIPPLTRSVITNVGVNVTVTEKDFDGANYVVFQKIENDPLAVPAVQQAIQNTSFFYNGWRPREISIYTEFALTPSTNMTIEVFDTSQAPVTVTNGTVTGTGAWASHTAEVARSGGTFDTGKPYTVRLTYNVNKGEYIRLARVYTTFWPYP